MSSLEKVKVYVHSLKNIPVQEYLDMESIRHPCSQAGERAFSGLKHFPQWDGVSGYLSDEEKRTIQLAAQFCEENKLDLEIIDLANVSLTKRVKIFLNGVRKVPAIAFRGEILTELSNMERLRALSQA